MPLDDATQPISRPPDRAPRRHETDIAAVWVDKPAALDDHLSAAVADEVASLHEERAAKRWAKPTPEEDADFAASVSTVVATLPDATVRGLVNHVRTLTDPVDLAAWRQAWPKVFAGMTDEEASSVIRFADAMAQDEEVMPEHFGRKAVAVQMRARPASAMGAPAAGPGLPIKAMAKADAGDAAKGWA